MIWILQVFWGKLDLSKSKTLRSTGTCLLAALGSTWQHLAACWWELYRLTLYDTVDTSCMLNVHECPLQVSQIHSMHVDDMAPDVVAYCSRRWYIFEMARTVAIPSKFTQFEQIDIPCHFFGVFRRHRQAPATVTSQLPEVEHHLLCLYQQCSPKVAWICKVSPAEKEGTG